MKRNINLFLVLALLIAVGSTNRTISNWLEPVAAAETAAETAETAYVASIDTATAAVPAAAAAAAAKDTYTKSNKSPTAKTTYEAALKGAGVTAATVDAARATYNKAIAPTAAPTPTVGQVPVSCGAGSEAQKQQCACEASIAGLEPEKDGASTVAPAIPINDAAKTVGN